MTEFVICSSHTGFTLPDELCHLDCFSSVTTNCLFDNALRRNQTLIDWVKSNCNEDGYANVNDLCELKVIEYPDSATDVAIECHNGAELLHYNYKGIYYSRW